jgi:lipid II:glycine glycyltransferase (peptidoglycan interpeptide bridge formation enzyme)
MRIISNFDYERERSSIVFSTEFYNYLNTDIKGNLFFIEEDGIQMPVIIKNKSFFKIGYCVHPPLKYGITLNEKEEVDFFKKLYSLLKSNKTIDFIKPPIHIENFKHIPPSAIGHSIGIIRLSLKDKTEEEVFSQFKPIYRNLIRKAQKENVEVKFGIEYFDDFYKLYKDKLVLENAPYDSYEQIKKMVFSLDSLDRSLCGVAYCNGIPDAGIVNINDRINAYYFWAGTTLKPHQGSLRLLHWEIIKKYISLGIQNYRMGAAREGDLLNEKHARLLAFKTGFGSQVDKGFQFTFVVNKFKYNLYQFLIKLKVKIRK